METVTMNSNIRGTSPRAYTLTYNEQRRLSAPMGTMTTLSRRDINPTEIYPLWSRWLPLILKGLIFPPLAELYRRIYRKKDDVWYLQCSIKFALATLATTPLNHPSLPHYQQRLADSLCDRYRRLKREADLHLAIMLQHSVLEKILPTNMDITWPRRNLYVTYHLRYRHGGNVQCLDKAISLGKLVISELEAGSLDFASWSQSMATSYQLRYSRFGQIDDLEAELTWAMAAVESPSPKDPELSSRHLTLSIAYSNRSMHYRSLEDIDLALFWMYSAISNTPENHFELFIRHQNLASLYSIRYELIGNIEDINKAIEISSEYTDTTPREHPAYAQSLYITSLSLWSRHRNQGASDDLTTSIHYALMAVEASIKTDPNFGIFTGHLAATYLQQYRILGNLNDLESAFKWSEVAVLALGDSHGKAALYRHNYALVLHNRYRRHRDRNDLHLALKWSISSINLSRENDTAIQERRHSLAILYQDMFKLSGELSYLDDALEIQLKVVSDTSKDQPNAAEIYSTLAAIYSLLYQHKGGFENRDKIMEWNRAAVDAAVSGDPQLHIYKGVLALQYINRYHRLRDPRDLDHSLEMGKEALILVPPDHPLVVRHCRIVAEAYAERHNLERDDRDCQRALDYFQKSTLPSNGDPSLLWRAAQKWAAFAELHQLPESLDAYRTAYRILPELFWLGSRISSRHETLIAHEVGHVTTKAIAACMKFRSFELAVELLEQSLALTFQQLLDLQSDLTALEERFPQYASMLREVSTELQTIAVSTEDQVETTQRDRQRKLAMDRTALLKTIRELPEYDNFLLPVPFKSLITAAKSGPVIIINCSEDRCDTLILLHDGRLVHIFLPGVTSSAVSKQCEMLRSALRSYGIHSREIEVDRARRRRPFWRSTDGETVLNEVLDWIWKLVVSPIFQSLGSNNIVDGRIWWCLAGPLANLPLHAAGPPSPYIQSYTSTLSALIRARLSLPSQSKVNVIAVGLSEVAGDKPSLPNVKLEIEVLKSIVGEKRAFILMNEEATLDAVIKILPQARWLHLACHGQQGDAKDPLKSGLLLYDGKKLELEEIINTPSPVAEFVFLSACETAMGDTDMTNESLHLAGGMIFAGFKAAIGTLWSINDLDGPFIAKSVYSHLFQDGKEPNVIDTAEALHLAVEIMRKKGMPPHRWVPFIHIGI